MSNNTITLAEALAALDTIPTDGNTLILAINTSTGAIGKVAMPVGSGGNTITELPQPLLDQITNYLKSQNILITG